MHRFGVAAVCQHILLQWDHLESFSESSSFSAGCAPRENGTMMVRGTFETDNETKPDFSAHTPEEGFFFFLAGDLNMGEHAKLWTVIFFSAKSLH